MRPSLSRFLPYAGIALAALALGAAGHAALRPAPAQLPAVILRDTLWLKPPAFNASKPDSAPGKVASILRPRVRPQVVVASQGAEASTVARFCAPAKADTVRLAVADSSGDSLRVVVTPPPPAVLVTATEYTRSFPFGSPRLRVWSARNDSAGIMGTYSPGRWNHTTRVVGDSVHVRGDALGRLKTAGEYGIVGAVGVAIGFVIGNARR
jgi:hypothetical protein